MNPKVWIFRIAIGGLLSIPSLKAQAENWIELGSFPSGSVPYIDLDTLNYSDHLTEVWVKYDHSRDSSIEARETKIQFRVDCDARTFSRLFYIIYRPDRSILDQRLYQTYEQEAQPAIPGTFGEELVNLVCYPITGD